VISCYEIVDNQLIIKTVEHLSFNISRETTIHPFIFYFIIQSSFHDLNNKKKDDSSVVVGFDKTIANNPTTTLEKNQLFLYMCKTF